MNKNTFLKFYLIGLKMPDHGLTIADHGLKITAQYYKITIFSILSDHGL